jgi:hypothetical protein
VREEEEGAAGLVELSLFTHTRTHIHTRAHTHMLTQKVPLLFLVCSGMLAQEKDSYVRRICHTDTATAAEVALAGSNRGNLELETFGNLLEVLGTNHASTSHLAATQAMASLHLMCSVFASTIACVVLIFIPGPHYFTPSPPPLNCGKLFCRLHQKHPFSHHSSPASTFPPAFCYPYVT